MKYIPFIIFALAFCIDTNAQEVQSDLLFNRAYKNDYNYKSNSGLLDLCNQVQIALEITEIKKPTCDSNDGSITIELTPDLSEYQIYINDSLVTETTESTYEIMGLSSGGFLVSVNADSALGCELFFTIDDEGEEPIDPDNFLVEDAFCGKGRIQKVGEIITQTFVYDIFNLKNENVGSVSNTLTIKRLDPGNYYVREQTSVGSCNAYWGFTIKDIPTNTIPFIDDFSKEIVYPNANKWQDKQAFVNRSFANSPYTLGVATLDGLNEFGQPYRVNDQPYTNSADSLTTNPFCLDDFEGDSLFLSFLYQPQGISDFPDGTDSLFVEVLDSEDNWHELWKISGEEATNNMEFEQVVLAIADDTASTTNATFFFDGFQIRFRNIATITGLNDPWHLDYIHLNENRFTASFIQTDFAFVYDMRPLLKNYYSMPWDQFYDYQAEEFVDTVLFTYRINENIATIESSDFGYDIFELCDSISIESEDGINKGGDRELNETLVDTIPLDINNLEDLGANKDIEENIVIRCNLTFDSDDFLKQNDTLEYNQIFSNYFAYDDGTAEKAYGLLGNGAQLALKFETNAPTQLQGIQIYFTHIVGDVSQNKFAIKAWEGIDKGTGSIAKDDSLLMSKSGLVPYYTNEIGGFTTYLFEEPMTVDGEFYIGLEQTDKDILNIGQDYNNLVPSSNGIEGDLQHLFAAGKMFYNTNGIWIESILPGAVMIRPVVGERELIQTGISTLENMKLAIYPNPTNGFLNIDGVENLSNYNVNIYDMTGKQLQHFTQENGQINVSSLASGMYMIQLTDNQNETIAHSKFVKY